VSAFFFPESSRGGDKKVLFFDQIQKINKTWKVQSRYILLTDKFVHLLKPAAVFGKYTVKHSIDVKKISSVSLSPFADNFFILSVDGDADFLLICTRKTEFLQSLQDLLRGIGMTLNM
jgi:hypothetical protein